MSWQGYEPKDCICTHPFAKECLADSLKRDPHYGEPMKIIYVAKKCECVCHEEYRKENSDEEA